MKLVECLRLAVQLFEVLFSSVYTYAIIKRVELGYINRCIMRNLLIKTVIVYYRNRLIYYRRRFRHTLNTANPFSPQPTPLNQGSQVQVKYPAARM